MHKVQLALQVYLMVLKCSSFAKLTGSISLVGGVLDLELVLVLVVLVPSTGTSTLHLVLVLVELVSVWWEGCTSGRGGRSSSLLRRSS